MRYYEVTVRELIDEEKNKFANRQYLVEAVSPTDADAIVNKNMASMTNWRIVGMKESKLSELWLQTSTHTNPAEV